MEKILKDHCSPHHPKWITRKKILFKFKCKTFKSQWNTTGVSNSSPYGKIKISGHSFRCHQLVKMKLFHRTDKSPQNGLTDFHMFNSNTPPPSTPFTCHKVLNQSIYQMGLLDSLSFFIVTTEKRESQLNHFGLEPKVLWKLKLNSCCWWHKTYGNSFHQIQYKISKEKFFICSHNSIFCVAFTHCPHQVKKNYSEREKGSTFECCVAYNYRSIWTGSSKWLYFFSLLKFCLLDTVSTEITWTCEHWEQFSSVVLIIWPTIYTFIWIYQIEWVTQMNSI